MALEIANSLVAAISGGGPIPVVAAQFGIVTLERLSAGVYRFTTLEGLGDSEYATTCLIDGAAPGFISVLQIDATTWEVQTFDIAEVPDDYAFHVKIHRIATG